MATKQMRPATFVLESPYGYITPKFNKAPIWNGAVGTVLDDGRVRFNGLREAVEVPRHWRKRAQLK